MKLFVSLALLVGFAGAAAPPASAKCELSTRDSISFLRKMSPAFVSGTETKIVIGSMDELASVLDMKRLLEDRKKAVVAEKAASFNPTAAKRALGCITTEKELKLAQRKIGESLLDALTMQQEQFCGFGSGAAGICSVYKASMAAKIMAGSCHGDPRVDGGKVKQCTPALKQMAEASFVDAQKKGFDGVAKALDYSGLHSGFFASLATLRKSATYAPKLTGVMSVPLFMGTVRKMTIPEYAADDGVKLTREQAVCQKEGGRAIGELHQELDEKIAFYTSVIGDLDTLWTNCVGSFTTAK
jgi:hypothetical protein